MKVPEENMGEYIYNCEMKRPSKIWHKTQTSWRKTLLIWLINEKLPL